MPFNSHSDPDGYGPLSDDDERERLAADVQADFRALRDLLISGSRKNPTNYDPASDIRIVCNMRPIGGVRTTKVFGPGINTFMSFLLMRQARSETIRYNPPDWSDEQLGGVPMTITMGVKLASVTKKNQYEGAAFRGFNSRYPQTDYEVNQ